MRRRIAADERRKLVANVQNAGSAQQNEAVMSALQEAARRNRRRSPKFTRPKKQKYATDMRNALPMSSFAEGAIEKAGRTRKTRVREIKSRGREAKVRRLNPQIGCPTSQ